VRDPSRARNSPYRASTAAGRRRVSSPHLGGTSFFVEVKPWKGRRGRNGRISSQLAPLALLLQDEDLPNEGILLSAGLDLDGEGRY